MGDEQARQIAPAKAHNRRLTEAYRLVTFAFCRLPEALPPLLCLVFREESVTEIEILLEVFDLGHPRGFQRALSVIRLLAHPLRPIMHSAHGFVFVDLEPFAMRSCAVVGLCRARAFESMMLVP